jgi:hypothetical protein
LNIDRITYEKGLELRLLADYRWYFQSVGAGHVPIACDPRAVLSTYHVQPLLYSEAFADGTRRTHLVLADGTLFGLRTSCLYQRAPTVFPIFMKAYIVDYIVGALGYHCQRLAELYAEITRHFSSIQLFQDNPEGFATFQGQPEPYYEFDAFITVARRTYDYTRYLLWYSFGQRRSSTPSSFRRTLDNCKNLPAAFAERLEKSWTRFGDKLTDYRDCIQHYIALDSRNSTAYMQRLPEGPWSMSVWLPDNPKQKSSASFTFSARIDALTYAWQLTNELVEVASIILDAVPREIQCEA